jgi:hypothetical protein
MGGGGRARRLIRCRRSSHRRGRGRPGRPRN